VGPVGLLPCPFVRSGMSGELPRVGIESAAIDI